MLLSHIKNFERPLILAILFMPRGLIGLLGRRKVRKEAPRA